MSLSTPVKSTHKWREDLQQFRRNHAISKKVLLNCCLIKRIIAWANPSIPGFGPHSGRFGTFGVKCEQQSPLGKCTISSSPKESGSLAKRQCEQQLDLVLYKIPTSDRKGKIAMSDLVRHGAAKS
ncbi:UNVERIFIED_CONTAM: hypothetical protein FKN15_016192 [Acipenser sinensis]